MFKKLLIAFFGLIAALLLAIILIPLFIDVDKYRPQLVEMTNEHLNGKVELGHLSLSLWGQVKVQIDGLKVTDARSRPVVSVKDAFFHMPFASLLSGAPELVLSMDSPALEVAKDKSGKLNVMSLAKTEPKAPAAGGGGAATPSESKPTSLPGIATRARLGVLIQHAQLTYKDELTGLSSSVNDLNVRMENVSLSHPMQLEVTALIDTTMKATAKTGEPPSSTIVRGPVKLTATATPTLKDSQFDHLDLISHVDLDQLEIQQGALFHKKPGMDAHADLALTASATAATIQKLDVKFFNAEMKATGSIANLGATAAPGAAAPSPVVDLTLASNPIDLKPWNQLVPMLNDYDLAGTASLNASAKGPSDKLNYKALAKIDDLTAKAPHLKAEPRIDAVLSVVTDQVDNLTLTMKAPGNDLKVHGTVVSFTKPHAEFQVTSSGMDLDQLIVFPPPGEKPKAQAAAGAAPAPGGPAAAPPADLDASVAPLRANKMLAESAANVAISMKLVKAQGVAVSDIAGKLSFHDLIAGLSGFGMKIFGGAIHADFSTDLKPKAPTYRLSTKVDGLDLQQAVSSSMHLFKDTLLGKASFEMIGDGASFNAAPATQNLKAKGKLKVENAVFASIDVGKMVADGLNGAIDKIADKLPPLKGKRVNGVPGGQSKYSLISTDFTIAGGKFTAPDFVAKAAPNQGIDLKGAVAVDLKEYTLKTDWQVIDTFNLTKAKDLSVNQAGIDIPHILAEGNEPVKFPVSAGCNLKAPCYSYTQVPEYLGKVALNNAAGAASGKAKAELKKQADQLIKQAPPGLQNQLNGLGSKLFGH